MLISVKSFRFSGNNCMKLVQKNFWTFRLLATQAEEKISNKNFKIQDQSEATEILPYEKIPGPSKFQLIKWFIPGGQLYNKSFEKLNEILKHNYGSIAKIPGLFGRPDMVAIFDANDIEKVYRNEGPWPVRPGFDTFEYYRRVLQKDLYKDVEGLSVLHGEAWGRLRTIANPILMQPRTINIYASRMNEVASDFIDKVREIRDPKTLEVPDDFFDHISMWTFESVCLVALDTKLDLIKDPSKHPDAIRMKKSMDIVFSKVVELDLKPSMWKWFPTPDYLIMMSRFDEITNISRKYIEKALEKLKEKELDDRDIKERSVLERLLMADKKFAITMAMDLLLAGVDTTAAAFVSCLICLAKNPDKQDILREEIKNILPEKNSPMTKDTVRNLPYLRSCIKEGLRIYPIAFGNTRALPNDIELSGYHIPKNTHILMPSTLLFNTDEYFPESDKFLPERWLRKDKTTEFEESCPFSEKEGKSFNPFIYLPFGFGPRMCIGKRLVDMELEVLLSKIIRNFYVEFNYPTDNLFKMTVLNFPNKPLNFKFIET